MPRTPLFWTTTDRSQLINSLGPSFAAGSPRQQGGSSGINSSPHTTTEKPHLTIVNGLNGPVPGKLSGNPTKDAVGHSLAAGFPRLPQDSSGSNIPLPTRQCLFWNSTDRPREGTKYNSVIADKGEVVIMDDSDDGKNSAKENSAKGRLKGDYYKSHSAKSSESCPDNAEPRQKSKKRFLECLEISLVRTSIGHKVYSHRCRMQFLMGTQKPFLVLFFAESADTLTEREIKIPIDAVAEMKYCLVNDDDTPPGAVDDNAVDQITFIAIKLDRLEGNKSSDRLRNNNSYRDKLKECGNFGRLIDICGTFIALEIRDDADFKEKLPMIRKNQLLSAFLGADSNIHPEKASKYISALKKHSESERLARMSASLRSSVSSITTSANSEAKHKILLVYPFIGGDRIEKAAEGLKLLCSLDEQFVSSEELIKLQQEATTGRAHFLSITGEDRDRLEPGEFLNDTLVDFWMRWICRKEAPSKSCVHFFTSHFFTTLKEEGVKAISSWTSKKGIDVFSKRIIFLPINQSFHWSLCAVVNPGSIVNLEKVLERSNDSYGELQDSGDEESNDYQNVEVPCILFLDSLKAHQKAVVAKHVRNWLNHEWKKMKKGEDDVFTNHSIGVYAPTVPYQYNSWDCGVFVCKYACSLYQKRLQPITYRDLHEKKPLMSAVTNSRFMKFDMSDIAELRHEMCKLIDNLSCAYLEMKQTIPAKAMEYLDGDEGDVMVVSGSQLDVVT